MQRLCPNRQKTVQELWQSVKGVSSNRPQVRTTLVFEAPQPRQGYFQEGIGYSLRLHVGCRARLRELYDLFTTTCLAALLTSSPVAGRTRPLRATRSLSTGLQSVRQFAFGARHLGGHRHIEATYFGPTQRRASQVWFDRY
jgi:hypothetical protein